MAVQCLARNFSACLQLFLLGLLEWPGACHAAARERLAARMPLMVGMHLATVAACNEVRPGEEGEQGSNAESRLIPAGPLAASSWLCSIGGLLLPSLWFLASVYVASAHHAVRYCVGPAGVCLLPSR